MDAVLQLKVVLLIATVVRMIIIERGLPFVLVVVMMLLYSVVCMYMYVHVVVYSVSYRVKYPSLGTFLMLCILHWATLK